MSEEKTGTIGNILKNQRLFKKLSIDTVSFDLKIRKEFLQALEKSDYNFLPNDVYTIGFLKSYSNYLKLNTSEIVKMYKEEVNKLNNDFNKQDINHEEDLKVMKKPSMFFDILILLLILILLVFAGYKLFEYFSKETIETSNSNINLINYPSTQTIPSDTLFNN